MMINLDFFSSFLVKDILSLKAKLGAKNIHVKEVQVMCFSEGCRYSEPNCVFLF